MASKISTIRVGRILAVEREEYFKTGILFAYLFFMTAATIVGRTAADTLFLSRFDATKLSYMYLAISIALSICGVAFHAIVDRFRRDRLIYAVTGGMILAVGVTRIFVDSGWSLMYPMIYVGFEVFNFLLILQFWTFTNDVLDTRQAKRLIGIILSAGILGGMISGFSIKALVHAIGTSNLITMYGGLMGLCVILVRLLARREFTDTVRETHSVTDKKAHKKAEEKHKLGSIYHLKLIAIIVSIITMVLMFIDYQFKMVLKEYYRNDELAAVLGQFYGYTGIVALVFQFFLSSRILSKYGILVSLLILPIFLLISSLSIWFAPAIPGTVMIGSMALYLMPILNAVVFAKASDKIFSDTIYSSASQLMYVPLHANVRGRAKVFVDGIIKPLSKSGSAILLILSAHFFPVAVNDISLAVVGLLIICIIAIFLVKREYVKSLFSTLKANQIDFKDINFNVSDSSAIEILVQGLESQDDRRVLYCLDALKNIEGFYLIPHVLTLMHHKSPRVRTEALRVIEKITPRQATGEVIKRLEDDHTEVKVQAILTLSAYADDNHIKRILSFLIDEDSEIKGAAISGLMQYYGIDGIFYSVDIFKQMLESPRINDRKEIARIIGRIGLKNFHKPLIKLLDDPSKEVQIFAIDAAHRINAIDLIPMIIKKLKQKETRHKAMEALSAFDAADIVPTLRTYLEFSRQYQEISLYIPRVFEMIASQECADIMLKNYDHAGPYLRLKILDSLAKIQFRNHDVELDRDLIEKWINLEFQEHRFFTQTLNAAKPFDGIAILIESVTHIRHGVFERVFKLLGFLHDHKVITTVFLNLSNTDKRVQANAVEVLDNMLEGELRTSVVQIVNSHISHKFNEERDAIKFFDTLMAAYGKDHDWLKMCVEFVSTSPKFDEWDHNRAFALRKLIHDTQVSFERKEVLNIIQKVAILKRVSFFASLSGEYLANIALQMKSAKCHAGEAVFHEGETGDSFYVVIKGKVLIHKGETRLVEMGPGQCFGEMAILDNEKRSASVTALEDTLMFKLESEAFYDIIADRIEIAKGVIRMLTQRLRQQLAKVAAAGGGAPKPVIPQIEESAVEEMIEGESANIASELDSQALLKRVLLLKEIDLFASLPDEDMVMLANTIEEVKYKKGQDIFLEGDQGDAMYGIVSGSVLIHKGNKDLATLGEKKYFGEMAVLDNEPRSASVTAVADTTLLKLSSDDFYSILFDKVEITRNIFAVLVQRLRTTNTK
ncbi:MAG TPA: Npt1/Npt2 family nucleotide transporter [bacterium]|nr:Npt1/Npt2 family nucleotide transporter [bacterium]